MNQELLLQEQLLSAWMRMSTFIRGNRILSELSFTRSWSAACCSGSGTAVPPP